MDMDRLENFAIRLSAQYAAARNEADRQEVEHRIAAYTDGDEEATRWLRDRIGIQ